MPNSFVDKFSGGESKWQKAKKVAKSQGKGDNYAYIMGIFKKMVGAQTARLLSIVTRIKASM